MNTTTERPVHIVLGATGGIGGALVERLAAKGHRLVPGARTEDALRETADRVGMGNHEAVAAAKAGVAGLTLSAALHPMGRIGEPGDIASLIEWLLDPEQSWVTGQEIGVDGGLATVRPPLRPGGAR